MAEIVAAAAPVLSYQHLSHHGHGVVQFVPALAEDVEPVVDEPLATPVPTYGGYEFTSTDFIYYRFPEPASFPLDRLLHRVVTDEALRTECATDPAVLAARAGLTDEQRDALPALSSRQVALLEQQRQEETEAVPAT